MNVSKPGKVDKSWGYEIIWSSNHDYCGKILVFEQVGAKTTMTIHKNRKKSWFVNAGRFKIIYTDIKTGITAEAYLEEGKTVDLAEMSPHSIEAMAPNSMIFEAGMPDNLDDIFRLTPDDTQKSGEEPK